MLLAAAEMTALTVARHLACADNQAARPTYVCATRCRVLLGQILPNKSLGTALADKLRVVRVQVYLEA